jgi:hypothetical protein
MSALGSLPLHLYGQVYRHPVVEAPSMIASGSIGMAFIGSPDRSL